MCWWDVRSDHYMKLTGHYFSKFCQVTDCYFQHCLDTLLLTGKQCWLKLLSLVLICKLLNFVSGLYHNNYLFLFLNTKNWRGIGLRDGALMPKTKINCSFYASEIQRRLWGTNPWSAAVYSGFKIRWENFVIVIQFVQDSWLVWRYLSQSCTKVQSMCEVGKTRWIFLWFSRFKATIW